MPLYLATHTQEVVTAKVPLTMIMLLDFVKRKSLPAELKCRVVLPTGDTVSASLWDAPSPEQLLDWLNTNLQYDATHAVHEVQEEFSWGLTFELTRLRAAEKVVTGGRGAMDRLSATAAKAGESITKQLEALDQRSGIITAAENAITRVRTAATTTFHTTTPGAGAAEGVAAPAAAAAGDAAGGYAADGPGPRGAAATTSITANMKEGLTKASATFSWLGSVVKEQLRTATTATAATGAAGATPAQHADLYSGPAAADASAAPAPASRTGSGARPVAAGREDVGQEEEESAPLKSLPQVALAPAPDKATAAPTAAAAPTAPPLPVSQLPTSAPPPPQFTLDDDEGTPTKA